MRFSYAATVGLSHPRRSIKSVKDTQKSDKSAAREKMLGFVMQTLIIHFMFAKHEVKFTPPFQYFFTFSSQ